MNAGHFSYGFTSSRSPLPLLLPLCSLFPVSVLLGCITPSCGSCRGSWAGLRRLRAVGAGRLGTPLNPLSHLHAGFLNDHSVTPGISGPGVGVLGYVGWAIRPSLSSTWSGLGRGPERWRVRGSSRRWWTIRARDASLRYRMALLRVPATGEGFHVQLVALLPGRLLGCCLCLLELRRPGV